jgi:hypothetical protein
MENIRNEGAHDSADYSTTDSASHHSQSSNSLKPVQPKQVVRATQAIQPQLTHSQEGSGSHFLAGSANDEDKERVIVWFDAIASRVFAGEIIRRVTPTRYDVYNDISSYSGESGKGDITPMRHADLVCEFTVQDGE